MISRKLVTYNAACEMLGIKKTLLHELVVKKILDRRALPVPGRKRPVNRITIESIEAYQKGGPAWTNPHVQAVAQPKPAPKPRKLSRELVSVRRPVLQFVGR